MLSNLDLFLGYLDPGTGALVIQVVIASLLTTGIFFRRLFTAPFKFLFRRGKAADATEESDDSQANQIN